MWRLLDMTDEEFLKLVDCGCVYYRYKGYCADDCQYNCADGRLKWLKQEHEGGDGR
jgi:hypothetical protein